MYLEREHVYIANNSVNSKESKKSLSVMNTVSITLLPILTKGTPIPKDSTYGNFISNKLSDNNNDYHSLETTTRTTIEDELQEVAAIPSSLYIITILVLAILFILTAFNTWFYTKYAKDKKKTCENCNQEENEEKSEKTSPERQQEFEYIFPRQQEVDELLAQISERKFEERKELPSEDESFSEDESCKNTSDEESDEDDDDKLTGEQPKDTVSEKSVEVTLEIETYVAKNTSLLESKQDSVECERCGKLFADESSMRHHMLTDHANDTMKDMFSESTIESVKLNSIVNTTRNLENTGSLGTLEDILQKWSVEASKDSLDRSCNDIEILPCNITSASTVILSDISKGNSSSNNIESLPCNITFAPAEIISSDSKADSFSKDSESPLSNFTSTSHEILSENSIPENPISRNQNRRRSGKKKNKSTFSVPCTQCGGYFATQSGLEKHTLSKH